jgi:hypothetical protein
VNTDRTALGARLEAVSSEIELHTALKPLWPVYSILFKRRRRSQFHKFKQLVESQAS